MHPARFPRLIASFLSAVVLYLMDPPLMVPP